MSLLSRITGRKRMRDAARRLGLDPSSDNYLALAREHIVGGDTQEVLRVCTEGLQIHPGNPELARLAERARTLNLETRVRILQNDLKISPRPALWKELCDILIQTRRYHKAEEAAEEWYTTTRDGESLYYRSRCRSELFYEGRRAEDGRVAYQLAEQSVQLLPGDQRPLHLQFEIARRCGAWHEARTAIARLLELMPGARRCGAWHEARTAIARLLELMPGNPDLESRFRSILASVHESRPLDQALVDVERSGHFVDDVRESSRAPANVRVRPALQQLGAEPGVSAAVFLRGGTALVQGPHGATADRTARLVREVVQRTRSTARRMALGRVMQVHMEGEFGVFHLMLGEHGSAALWCTGAIKRPHLEVLSGLAGAAGGAA